MKYDHESLFESSLRNFNSTCAPTAIGLCAALAFAPTSEAQSTPQPQPTGSTNAPAAALPEVTVTGQQGNSYKPETISNPRIAGPLRDTPQTINVVPRAVFEDQNATTLRDVLRNVPGISFQAGEGGVPAGDQMTIRGNPARTDMFIDGVRDVGGYTRDSFNVEQVEVFKGPNSAYSGRGSMGGTVNMVSKTPTLDQFYNTSLSYGSYDYYRGTVDINQPLAEGGLEHSALRFNAMYHDQDYSGRDYVEDSRWALNPTLAFGINTDTRVILSYLHLKEDNLAGYGLPFVSSSTNVFGGASALGKVAPLPYSTFFGIIGRDYEDIANDIGGVRFEHDFTADVKLMNQTRYAQTKRDSIITAPRFTGTNNVFLNHQVQSRDQTDEIFSNQTDLRYNFETGPVEQTLVTTLEYAKESEVNYLRTTRGAASVSPAADPNPFTSFRPVVRTGARNEAKTDSAGLSVFDTANLTEKFILSGGLRGDIFAIDYTQYTTNSVLKQSRTDVEPTWRGGLAYKPKPFGSIYVGYGTSFSPAGEGLTLATNVNAINNINLEPELGNSYEFGTKWDLFKEQLSIAAAVFRTDKENVRQVDAVTGIAENGGDQRFQGFEFGISGRVTRHWTLYGGYTFTHSEVTKSIARPVYNGTPRTEEGNQVNNTPEQTASISTTYELPFRFTIGTGFYFMDQRYSNNLETQGVPGYWLQDAFISWKATKNIDLRLNVSNLWDEDYIDRVGGGHAIPGAGRTVIATTAFKF